MTVKKENHVSDPQFSVSRSGSAFFYYGFGSVCSIVAFDEIIFWLISFFYGKKKHFYALIGSGYVLCILIRFNVVNNTLLGVQKVMPIFIKNLSI